MIFAVHKLAEFSSKPGKVHFEVLEYSLRYIWYNKTLGLNYYAKMNGAPVSDMLIQTSINDENQLVAFSDSSCQDCPDTGRITGAYIIVHRGWTTGHGTHAPAPVSQ